MRLLFSYFLIATLAVATACTSRQASTHDFTDEVYAPIYATGFHIYGADDTSSAMLVTENPWQGADGVTSRLLILRDGEAAPDGFDGRVINGDARRIVAMSSSHIALLDAIDATDRIVGVSGMQFITNPKITSRADKIADVGYDNNIDYELLLSIEPDLVLLYGVNGSNAIEAKLRELRIPFVYIGEYVEQSPLAKAEWIVALAEIVGMRQQGIEAFDPIADRYNALRDQAAKVALRPKVMLNTPYEDVWYMPSTQSYIVRLITDAGADYVYTADTGSVSKPIDLEEAYMLTSESDFWINVGQANSLAHLRAECPKFMNTRPVEQGNVYNCTRRSTADGGNDFWESGIVKPDVILDDMIKIFHPELSQNNDSLYFYEQLK